MHFSTVKFQTIISVKVLDIVAQIGQNAVKIVMLAFLEKLNDKSWNCGAGSQQKNTAKARGGMCSESFSVAIVR